MNDQMSDPITWQEAHAGIAAAQDFLKNHRYRPQSGAHVNVPAAALPGLLQQYREMSSPSDATTLRPMRSIHHFACTGGTLISRCIAAMPNTQVLSEVDPLNPLPRGNGFVPTDLIGLARFGSRPPSQEVLVEMFLSGLGVLADEARRTGVDVVLRDHAHGQFCSGAEIVERPTLQEILRTRHALRSLVTVRHPLDSYLSLGDRGWVLFTPTGIEEYACRYMGFLDRYSGVEILRYEDFVANPKTRMRHICKVLGLSYNPEFQQVLSALHLSGDSGRTGVVISMRARRSIPQETKAGITQSATYAALCARLGYAPEPDASALPSGIP